MIYSYQICISDFLKYKPFRFQYIDRILGIYEVAGTEVCDNT